MFLYDNYIYISILTLIFGLLTIAARKSMATVQRQLGQNGMGSKIVCIISSVIFFVRPNTPAPRTSLDEFSTETILTDLKQIFILFLQQPERSFMIALLTIGIFTFVYILRGYNLVKYIETKKLSFTKWNCVQFVFIFLFITFLANRLIKSAVDFPTLSCLTIYVLSWFINWGCAWKKPYIINVSRTRYKLKFKNWHLIAWLLIGCQLLAPLISILFLPELIILQILVLCLSGSIVIVICQEYCLGSVEWKELHILFETNFKLFVFRILKRVSYYFVVLLLFVICALVFSISGSYFGLL
jgi:hypothetical protein